MMQNCWISVTKFPWRILFDNTRSVSLHVDRTAVWSFRLATNISFYIEVEISILWLQNRKAVLKFDDAFGDSEKVIWPTAGLLVLAFHGTWLHNKCWSGREIFLKLELEWLTSCICCFKSFLTQGKCSGSELCELG